MGICGYSPVYTRSHFGFCSYLESFISTSLLLNFRLSTCLCIVMLAPDWRGHVERGQMKKKREKQSLW